MDHAPRLGRLGMLSVALVLLAGALVFHATFSRYETRHMTGLLVMRTDRLTGRVELCRGSMSAGAFVCGGPELRATPNPDPPGTP